MPVVRVGGPSCNRFILSSRFSSLHCGRSNGQRLLMSRRCWKEAQQLGEEFVYALGKPTNCSLVWPCGLAQHVPVAVFSAANRLKRACIQSLGSRYGRGWRKHAVLAIRRLNGRVLSQNAN